MTHTKASLSPHDLPPQREAVVRRAIEGNYRESMPAEPGRDAELLQAVLLMPYRGQRTSATASAFMGDWLTRLVEWFGRLWATCLAMLGVRR